MNGRDSDPDHYSFELFDVKSDKNLDPFCIFLGGLECAGHSFAYVDHFVFFWEMSDFEPRELP